MGNATDGGVIAGCRYARDIEAALDALQAVPKLFVNLVRGERGLTVMVVMVMMMIMMMMMMMMMSMI